MILIDSAVWIDHLRRAEPRLEALYRMRNILGHPFVLGELAMGSLRKREETLYNLRLLPQARIATDEDVQQFVSRNALFGLGIGYIDAHLLASTQLTPDTLLWTRDKRLLPVAEKLGLAMVEAQNRPN